MGRADGGVDRESACVLAFLLCCQGAIWAKPTWGVWWDWDPRLTTTAVLLFAFLGILALRKFVDDPARRAMWSAVATIVAYVDVPIVYFSVSWWNSLHQQQSNPETVRNRSGMPLRINAFGMLFLMIGVHHAAARVAALRPGARAGAAAPGARCAELGEARMNGGMITAAGTSSSPRTRSPLSCWRSTV